MALKWRSEASAFYKADAEIYNSINETLMLPCNALQWSDVFSNQVERQPKMCEQYVLSAFIISFLVFFFSMFDVSVEYI